MRGSIKKAAAMLITAAICAVSSLLPASAEGVDYLLGDADVDGDVSIADVTAIQRYEARFSLLTFKGENLGDVNRDGICDVIDATLLQRWHAMLPSAEGIEQPVEPRTMAFEDGMAQQIVRYTDARDSGYINTGSDIIRYTVYVETDCDTDLDGKPDLLKAWVQVPRPAAEGDYRAPVIYEARPYCAGTDLGSFNYSAEPLDESELKTRPQKRVPKGRASAEDAAALAKASDWYYTFSSDRRQTPYYNNLTTYDYYLVRGFAVVGCAGLGTMGSEGLNICGSSLERDAFAAVVEWLHGDRAAYTDTTGDIATEADWCSGRIGMTGRSYSGAMAYEVAASGTDGLETIVPVAGPSSWYDYCNSQGAALMTRSNYIAYLSEYCSSRLFENYDSNVYDNYARWLTFAADSQKELDGDYGDFWTDRDCSGAGEDIKASALIVHGLNDNNVRTKHFDLMWRAFERSGAEHKAILHQNDHMTPAFETNKTDIMIGGYTYTELLNRWFCHYLADVDNGIDQMSAVTVQSNTDGSFCSLDSLEASGSVMLSPDDGEAYSTVYASGAHESNDILTERTFTGQPSDNAALWHMDLTEPVTINGAVEVRLRIKGENISGGDATVAAALVDTSDTPFNVYSPGTRHLGNRVIGTEPMGDGLPSYKLVEWLPATAGKKIVATGIMDLKNPGAGYMPSSSATPVQQIHDGEWYDYTLYLQPNLYTAAAGHRLELYILPFVNGEYDKDILSLFTGDMVESLGYRKDYLVRRKRDYSFTVDNSQSCAVIPVNN